MSLEVMTFFPSPLNLSSLKKYSLQPSTAQSTKASASSSSLRFLPQVELNRSLQLMARYHNSCYQADFGAHGASCCKTKMQCS
jgi:hypothetical protein